jgi:ABC-2 type transport system ATP-binding protein
MEFTDLMGLRQKMCEALSKGMRQRLGLARTLIHNPSVLILDEPAAALDPRARIEFRELLLELARRGKAVLISSHILTELSEIVNSVAIIERGRILATGAVGDIRRRLTPVTVLRISLLDRLEVARKAVQIHPNVDAVRVAGKDLEVEYRGDEAGRAALLRDLVQAGHAVTQFTFKEQNLEDIFMQITTGKVQ